MKRRPDHAERKRAPLVLRAWWWLRSAYLTWRHVDAWRTFPALWVWDGAKLRIRKAKGARIELNEEFVVEPWIGTRHWTTVTLGTNAHLKVDFPIHATDNVRINVGRAATLSFGDPLQTSALANRVSALSGCLIMARRRLRVGRGAAIAWETYITDSDWHPLDGNEVASDETILGEMVWIQPGCKVLKGAKLGAGTVVAANSVVLAGDYPEGSLLAGAPAQVRGKAPRWSNR